MMFLWLKYLYIHGYSHVMTSLYLKVHNGWGKYSIGSVFQIFYWFSFPPPHQVQFWHLSMAMLKTIMCGHLCMMTFLHSQELPRKNCQNRLTHLCVNYGKLLRLLFESPIKDCTAHGQVLSTLQANSLFMDSSYLQVALGCERQTPGPQTLVVPLGVSSLTESSRSDLQENPEDTFYHDIYPIYLGLC